MMELATMFSSSNPALKPISPALKPCPRGRSASIVARNRGTNGRDSGSRGKLVDENMIQLRLRIKEIKMLEACNDPPPHWMEWEKQYLLHNNYNNDVCEAVGLLQNCLLNSRPSLALGMVAVVCLSVPVATGVVLFQAVEIAMKVLSALRYS